MKQNWKFLLCCCCHKNPSILPAVVILRITSKIDHYFFPTHFYLGVEFEWWIPGNIYFFLPFKIQWINKINVCRHATSTSQMSNELKSNLSPFLPSILICLSFPHFFHSFHSKNIFLFLSQLHFEGGKGGFWRFNLALPFPFLTHISRRYAQDSWVTQLEDGKIAKLSSQTPYP